MEAKPSALATSVLYLQNSSISCLASLLQPSAPDGGEMFAKEASIMRAGKQLRYLHFIQKTPVTGT